MSVSWIIDRTCGRGRGCGCRTFTYAGASAGVKDCERGQDALRATYSDAGFGETGFSDVDCVYKSGMFAVYAARNNNSGTNDGLGIAGVYKAISTTVGYI